MSVRYLIQTVDGPTYETAECRHDDHTCTIWSGDVILHLPLGRVRAIFEFRKTGLAPWELTAVEALKRITRATTRLEAKAIAEQMLEELSKRGKFDG